MNGDEVGKISKQWSGLAREMFTGKMKFDLQIIKIRLDLKISHFSLSRCRFLWYYFPDGP